MRPPLDEGGVGWDKGKGTHPYGPGYRNESASMYQCQVFAFPPNVFVAPDILQ